MIIININKKLQVISITIVLISSLEFNIYNHIRNMELTNNHEATMCLISQFDKSNLISYIVSSCTSIKRNKNVEIFDITEGRVIQEVQLNSIINKEVEGYLNRITGMYKKVKALPDKGYIIKIPCEPSVKVKSNWLNDYGINSVNEVFILFPEQGDPYLLILDERRRPLFFNFEGNTDELLKKLNFNPGIVE